MIEDVLSEHLDALYRTALRMAGGREADAEDLVQDVALKAHQRFSDLRDPGAARAWLFTILTRTQLNRWRSGQRRPEVAADDMDEAAFERALEAWRSPETPERVLDRTRTGRAVEAALDELDPALRSVIWLVDVEGFRQREVAGILDIPPGTVASRLFRARSTLRELLTGTNVAPIRARGER